MKTRIILAGAGGFAVEVFEYLRQDINAGKLRGCKLYGVLDDFPAKYYSKSGLPIPLLGGITDHEFRAEDRVVIAIGTPLHRETAATRLKSRGAKFLNYVHSSCYVASTARLGEGVLVCPNSILNYRCVLKDFVAMNIFTSAGHGSTIGAYSVLSPYAALNGDASIGDRTFLATRATIFPKVHVGNNCTVDTHSFVKASVGDGMIISNRVEYITVKDRLA